MLLDSGWRRPPRGSIAGVFLASLFAFFASSPTFDAPATGSNSFRFDTALVVVWGPLLYLDDGAAEALQEPSASISCSRSSSSRSARRCSRQQGEGGYWDTVLWPAAVAYYGTIKELSGLPGASLPVFFFVTRRAPLPRGLGEEGGGLVAPPPKFARNVAARLPRHGRRARRVRASCAAARRGTFRQIVHLIQLPLVALALPLRAARPRGPRRGRHDLRRRPRSLRSLLVVYVYFGVCMPAGDHRAARASRSGAPTHSDSVLFVSAHPDPRRARARAANASGRSCSALGVAARHPPRRSCSTTAASRSSASRSRRSSSTSRSSRASASAA